MPETMTPDSSSAPLKRLATLRATERKKLARQRNVGRVMLRMREIAGLSQKEVSARVGHENQAQVSRWEAGVENPALHAILAAKELRRPFLLAWAEECGVEVEYQLRMRGVKRWNDRA